MLEKTHTIYEYEKHLKERLHFIVGGDNLCQCLNRSAGRKILELVKKAADAQTPSQHRCD